jgi:catechol 2,3-dioxygenase-like lactoylglutathione lyase family enzyme
MSHRGFSHIGLSTLNLDKTRAFYEGVLGFKPVVADTITIEEGGHLPHMFFDVGGGQLIAFLEPNGVPDVPTNTRWGSTAGSAFPQPSTILPSKLGRRLRWRRSVTELRGKGVETTDIVDHGLAESIYFNDPDGLSLEYSCLVGDRPETDALIHGEFALPRAALELTDTLAKARSTGDRAKIGV